VTGRRFDDMVDPKSVNVAGFNKARRNHRNVRKSEPQAVSTGNAARAKGPSKIRRAK
jgi:hypothetical protein